MPWPIDATRGARNAAPARLQQLTISLVVVVALKAKDNNKIIVPDYVLSKTVAVIVDPNEQISAAHPNDNKQAADNVAGRAPSAGAFDTAV
jgi:hypothetical protein